MWALVAGGALFAGGLALVWAASHRRTVRVAVHEVPARNRRTPVKVRVRYDVAPDRALPAPDDLREVLGRLTKAAAEERQRDVDAAIREAHETWGVRVLGVDVEPTSGPRP